ncbi:hypothetical protein KGF57_004939 [Candida theae]|uniref:Uncharacterized protein n=1 Tax=Candida theae TaxID=1198502 RepID=A0AAD5BAR7_9ASCO|nr:uncharacterized protein KGF57_004939 [Candida theae]KAI5949109.1 hypothetical protein KGF57_004939 [Candida theae]
MTTLLDLPHHAISRIIFERWKMDYKYRNILSILYTCKQIYHDHYYVLYLLRPLVLGNTPFSTPLQGLQKLVQIGACCKIKTLYLIQPNKQLISSVTLFKSLVSVSISASLNDILNAMDKLPATVTDLTLCMTRNGMRLTKTQALTVPQLKLKTLIFRSLCCIRRASLSSFYDMIMRPIARGVDDSKYYKTNSPGKSVCELLAKLIHGSISTLKLLDLETVNAGQVTAVVEELIRKARTIHKIQVITVDQLGSNFDTAFKLLKICRKLRYINNPLNLEYILHRNEDGTVVQKLVATKPPTNSS